MEPISKQIPYTCLGRTLYLFQNFIYVYTYTLFTAILKLFGSRYKVSFTRDLTPEPYIRTETLPTDLVRQGWCSMVNVYTRIDTEAQKLVPDC